VTIFIFWLVSPFVIASEISSFFIVGVCVVWWMTSVILSRTFFFGLRWFNIAVIISILYIAAISLIFGGYTRFLSYVNFIYFLFAVLVGLYYSQARSTYHKQVLFGFLILIIIHSMITFVYNILLPGISRPTFIQEMARKGIEVSPSYYPSRGVGGYNFCYTIAVCIPIVFYMFKARLKDFQYFAKGSYISDKNDRQKLLWQLIGLGFVVTLFVGTLVASLYMYAIFGVFVSCLIIFLHDKRSYVVTSILGGLILITVGLALLINFDIIKVPNIYRSPLYKFNSLINSIKAGSPQSALAGRWMYYKESIHLIQRYPLFGAITVPFESGGGHSFILDTLAVFGVIFGSIINIFVLFCLFKFLFSTNKAPRVLSIALFVLIVFILIVNSIPQGIGVIAFYIFPAMYSTGLLKTREPILSETFNTIE